MLGGGVLDRTLVFFFLLCQAVAKGDLDIRSKLLEWSLRALDAQVRDSHNIHAWEMQTNGCKFDGFCSIHEFLIVTCLIHIL
jgi:hypothetical protein